MLAYLKFLLLMLISKVSTWVIIGIYTFLTIFIVYIMPNIIHEYLSNDTEFHYIISLDLELKI